MTNVRETRRADELKPGDWLAAEQLDGDGDRPSEVLSVHPYTGGITPEPGVLFVFRAEDGVPRSHDADADMVFELATQEELNADREAGERAQRIADIRAFADWLEANSWAPTPNHFDASVHLDERHPGGPGVADSYSKVREVAERLGVNAEERLDDRTVARKGFGHIGYAVIAWHPDGRPAEPEADR